MGVALITELHTLVGRESELDALREFLAAQEGGLAFVGEPGIGKTALWDAGIDEARRRDLVVLTAAPAEAEAQLAFAALGDLLREVLPGALDGLAPPRRHALEVALQIAATDPEPPQRFAVGLAFLDVVSALAQDQPVLVAIDDAQWLDAPTAAALGFALRRADAQRVRTLLTWRSEQQPAEVVGALAPRRVDVGPLSVGAIHRLLATHLGMRLPRARLRSVHERSHGNPLYALELARAVSAGTWLPGVGGFEPPLDLAGLVRARLDGLPRETRALLLHAAAASRPTVALLQASPDALEPAVDAGLVRLDGELVRFGHPLYASVCYRAADLAAQRNAHARLADAVTDTEERARHLALAATGPDESVAADLDVAARSARARGAPDTAAELAELARALTADPSAGVRRATQAAAYLLEAGDTTLAQQTLETAIETAAPGPDRGRALLALAEVLYESSGSAAAVPVARRALEEAGDDAAVRAAAHTALGAHSDLPGDEKYAHIQAALAALDAPETEPRTLAAALRTAAVAQFHLGRGLPDEPLERAHAIEQTLAERPPVAWRAHTIKGECLKYLDRFDEAEQLLDEAQRLAEASADESSLAEIFGHRAELALWLGRWDDALRFADAGIEAAHRTEQHGRIHIATAFHALVRAHRGDAAGARADAETAAEAAELARDRWAESETHWALGFVALSEGDPAAAAVHLGAVDALRWDHVLTETRQWRYLGDYVEALVATGDLGLARARLARLEQWAHGIGTAWSAALTVRARALVREAEGDAAGAAAELATALAALQDLPLPFEHARTRLLLGRVHRRARRKRDARTELDAALAGFEQLGSPLWAEQARQELARIGGRSPSRDVLTASERRVAELAAAGRSNKEIAAALVVSQRTVEAHLTRAYGKLGVRSRTELAHLLLS